MLPGPAERHSTRRAWRRLAVALLGCAAALALWAPTAPAVTIGPPIANLPVNVDADCDDQNVILWVPPVQGPPPSCSLLGSDSGLAWTSQVPRGQWVIHTARVRTGPRVGPMVFTVIRVMRSQATSDQAPFVAGAICCNSPVESQVFTPAPNAVNVVPVNLPVKNTVDIVDGEPIEVVDYLGVSLLNAGTTSIPMHLPGQGGFGSNSATSYIAPAMRAGQERLSDGTFLFPNVLLVNGEAEPARAGGGGGAGGAPAVNALALARAAFRAAGRGGSVRAAAKVGTKVTYGLSAAGKVAFTVQRRGAGRKAGGKCRKRTRANAGRKRCDLRLKGSFKHNGAAGPNSFTFTGRLKGRKLKPGRYNLLAKPPGPGAKAKRARFKIVAR